MKKYFLYIISDYSRNYLHAGISEDLKKTDEFYKGLPTLFDSPEKYLNKIVYCDAAGNKQDAEAGLNAFQRATYQDKVDIISAFNKDWIDLSLVKEFPFMD